MILTRLNHIPLYLYTIYLVFSLTSCGESEKSITIPPNILPKEKMARVITDIHMAEAEANLRTWPDSTSKTPISFQKIFEKDSVTKQQYEESLKFYTDNPELLNEVYENVLNDLSKLQASGQ
jgi:uncharacterized lipoprotein YehR (DUF1307 family)